MPLIGVFFLIFFPSLKSLYLDLGIGIWTWECFLIIVDLKLQVSWFSLRQDIRSDRAKLWAAPSVSSDYLQPSPLLGELESKDITWKPSWWKERMYSKGSFLFYLTQNHLIRTAFEMENPGDSYNLGPRSGYWSGESPFILETGEKTKETCFLEKTRCMELQWFPPPPVAPTAP